MHGRKMYSLIMLVILIFTFTSMLLIQRFFLPAKTVTYIDGSIEIAQNAYHSGNNRQQSSDVWLGSYNNQLFYYGGKKGSSNKTKYDNALFVFQDGAMVEVTPLSHGRKNITTILCMIDSIIYYRESDGVDYKNSYLYCYNLETNEDTMLYKGNLTLKGSMYFDDDGSVYFPLMALHQQEPQFVHVFGQNLLGVKTLTKGYQLGDNAYFVVSGFADVQVERILEIDQYGNVIQEDIPFNPAYSRSIIPCETGLLVHNAGLNSLLYHININGDIKELFSIPCLASQSAVNIHGTDVYISILRYEKYGEKGMLRYENDSVEGTYRISLADGAITKINDKCFEGMYNFDNTGFYCCDTQGNIYKMEFDGTVTPVLLLSQRYS